MPKQKLTKTSVKALANKAIKTRTSYYDTTIPGLSLRVSPSGSASWYYRFRVRGEGGVSERGFRKKGDRYRIHLGRYPSVNLASAKAKATKYAEMAERGENPTDGMNTAANANRLTVAALAKLFDTSYIETNIRAKNKYRHTMKLNILPHLGKRPANSITRADIASLTAKLATKNRRKDGRLVGGPEAARAALQVLQKMLGWAMAVGHVEFNGVNPAHGVSANVLPSPKSRDRHLTTEEARVVFQCAPDLDNASYAAFYQLMLLTGCRQHELTERVWDDIDLDQALMIVPRTKKDRVKVVPLVSEAVEIIAALPRMKMIPYVLPDANGGQLNTPSNKVHARLQELVNEALDRELPHWTRHDLRRTVATRLAEQGTDEKTLKKVLDHSDGGATAIYNQYAYTREVRAALELWARELLSQ